MGKPCGEPAEKHEERLLGLLSQVISLRLHDTRKSYFENVYDFTSVIGITVPEREIPMDIGVSSLILMFIHFRAQRHNR